MPELPDSPQRLPLRRAYPFLEAHGLADEAQAIRQASGGSPVHRGMAVDVLTRNGLLDEFIGTEWPNGATEQGRRSMDRYLRRYRRFLDGENETSEEDEEEDDPEETRFAYENQLRDYLANNLGLVEKGLRLWPVDEGAHAVEFAVDSSGRRIDILAADQAGMPVVIELKVSRGHERTIGQALYYRGRIKERFGVEHVRIIIVAREITEELKVAAADIPDANLFQYRLS